MVTRKEDLKPETIRHMKGGSGSVAVTRLFQPGSYDSAIRMIARLRLPPQAGLGYHRHEGEEEMISVVSGVAEYDDDGLTTILHAGDVCLCKNGHGHSIRNAGQVDDLMLLAVITGVEPL